MTSRSWIKISGIEWQPGHYLNELMSLRIHCGLLLTYVVNKCDKHIVAETKWLPFSRQAF